MQAVSAPLISSPSPELASFLPPQNVWIDINGVIVTALAAVCLLLSVFGKSDVSSA